MEQLPAPNTLKLHSVSCPMSTGEKLYFFNNFIASICIFVMILFFSCLNPLIYGFMSKHFRRSFSSTICLRPNEAHLVTAAYCPAAPHPSGENVT